MSTGASDSHDALVPSSLYTAKYPSAQSITNSGLSSAKLAVADVEMNPAANKAAIANLEIFIDVSFYLHL
jgi:hypothetical protein